MIVIAARFGVFVGMECVRVLG